MVVPAATDADLEAPPVIYIYMGCILIVLTLYCIEFKMRLSTGSKDV